MKKHCLKLHSYNILWISEGRTFSEALMNKFMINSGWKWGDFFNILISF